MTVQELIDILQKVEDKSKKVNLYTAWVDDQFDYDETCSTEIEHAHIQEFPLCIRITGCVPYDNRWDYEDE